MNDPIVEFVSTLITRLWRTPDVTLSPGLERLTKALVAVLFLMIGALALFVLGFLALLWWRG